VESEGPKSGWMCTEPPPIDAIHAAEWVSTGSFETSACQMLSAGKTEQVVPGGGVPVVASAVPPEGRCDPTAVGEAARQAVRTATAEATRVARRMCAHYR